jgi:hypothetical protein
LISKSDQALLSRVRAARAEYGQAVADLLEAVRRYSALSISDLEKEELLRQAREREHAAFSRYKETVEAV